MTLDERLAWPLLAVPIDETHAHLEDRHGVVLGRLPRCAAEAIAACVNHVGPRMSGPGSTLMLRRCDDKIVRVAPAK